jgi:hypothetical protein
MSFRVEKGGIGYCHIGGIEQRGQLTSNRLQSKWLLVLRNVPEGRCDRSLARSAWTSGTPKRSVPQGTVCRYLAGSGQRSINDEKYLWDELRPIIPYPTGRFFGGAFPRHFMPGYDRVVPPGQDVSFSGIRILLVVILGPRFSVEEGARG